MASYLDKEGLSTFLNCLREEELAPIQNDVSNLQQTKADNETVVNGLASVENKVDEGVSALSTKIENIDLSSVAKQGENKDATLSAVYDAVKRAPAIDDMYAEELLSAKSKIIKSLQDKNSDISDNATLIDIADKIEELIVVENDGIKLTKNFSSLEDLLTTDGAIDTFYSEKTSFRWAEYDNRFLCGLTILFSIKRIILPNATQNNQDVYTPKRTVEYIYAPKVTGHGSLNSICAGAETLKCADFSNLNQYSTGNGSYFLRYCSSLRHLYYNGHGGKDTMFYNNKAPALYDIRKTLPHIQSSDYRTWQASTALNVNSKSLLSKDEWDDPNEPTETFITNRDKFLWYFRNHFMNTFADKNGETSPVLTLSSSVYNVVMSHEDIVNHFTSINWTVASI